MSGYQEAVTDPSYAGQLLTFTYPHIGNYGVRADAMESERIHVRAVIMRAARNNSAASAGSGGGWLDWLESDGVAAITDVDTRALVRHIRDQGSMRGGIFPGEMPENEARALIGAEPSMDGRDLAREVSPDRAFTLEPLSGDGPTIAVLDTGVKASITRNLRMRGARLRVHPCTVSAAELLDERPDGVFIANGPGDPAALSYIVEELRGVLGRVPVFGICLGHQLVCRALGLETYKLQFGHRGANHPVKDLTTGRIEITSQNHGFAVLGPGGARTIEEDQPVRWETDFGVAELTHINLYDRTVEGLHLPEAGASTVQYHPEAGPGPHDALHLFDRFISQITQEHAATR
jgi:carbamoyl-phosphate synthase small subunit